MNLGANIWKATNSDSSEQEAKVQISHILQRTGELHKIIRTGIIH
jgi:hypothetical protein